MTSRTDLTGLALRSAADALFDRSGALIGILSYREGSGEKLSLVYPARAILLRQAGEGQGCAGACGEHGRHRHGKTHARAATFRSSLWTTSTVSQKHRAPD
jgi:hypothetical protein